MASGKRFTVFDGDSHVLEPREIWEKYLDPEYRTLGKFALWREEGEFGSYTVVNGKPVRDVINNNIPRHSIWRPGMTWEEIGDLDPSVPHPINEGAQDPQARLRDMDAMGVDQALLFPTIFAEQFPLVENPDVAYALARAYNDWIADFCKAAPDRLYAAAMIPLQNMRYAIDEMRRASGMGCFRAAFVRPMFVEDRYLNHPYYGPLWSELVNLNMPAAIHPTLGIHNPEYSSHGSWIEKVKNRLHQGSGIGGSTASAAIPGVVPLGHPIAEALAPWFDNSTFLLAVMFYSILDQHPSLRIVMAHSKASWLHIFLEKVETYVTLIPRHVIPVRTDAEEAFFESQAAIGFDADEVAVQRLPHRFEEKVVWESHYPNHDTTSAWDAIETLSRANLPESTIARMLGGNASQIYGTGARAG